MKIKKENRLLYSLLVITLLLFVVYLASGSKDNSLERNSTKITESKETFTSEETIRVGLLFSATGTSALLEKSMLNAAMLAFDEINENGGVNGKQIEYITEDYSSSPTLAKEKIEYLIEHEKVAATIGCYSSASRQAALPVIEKYQSLLIYPTYTEGEEEHPNVIYTGAMPNQQTSEFIPWLMKQCGKKVFLIGTDYVFPVICNKQAKILIEENGGEVCGELYLPAGELDFTQALEEIRKEKPDFIYCDLIGDSAVSFYKQYYKEGFSMEECPIASITTDEMTLQQMGAECSEGSYTSMNYFSTLDTEESKAFVEKYNAYVKDGSTITCLAEAAYDSCYLLAKALEKVENPYDTKALIQAFSGLEFEAPQGHIRVDEKNHCTWMYSRFARATNGQFEIVYESEELIQPDPWATVHP